MYKRIRTLQLLTAEPCKIVLWSDMWVALLQTHYLQTLCSDLNQTQCCRTAFCFFGCWKFGEAFFYEDGGPFPEFFLRQNKQFYAAPCLPTGCSFSTQWPLIALSFFSHWHYLFLKLFIACRTHFYDLILLKWRKICPLFNSQGPGALWL